jgi:hypothetical protein
MKIDVFIEKVSSFLPNNPIGNEEMEEYLGLIEGKPSRVKNLVLKQNGIQRRYYALNKNQEITHTNAELAAMAIRGIFKEEGDLADESLTYEPGVCVHEELYRNWTPRQYRFHDQQVLEQFPRAFYRRTLENSST